MNHPRAFALPSIALALAFLVAPAWADTQEVDGVRWGYSLQDGHATVTNATPATGDMVIPDSLGGCPVTSIRDYAFSDCGDLTSVTISESVTSIGDFAFSDCNGLTSVTILGNVTSHWGYYEYHDSYNEYWHSSCPFNNCTNIATLVLGDKMTTIGAGMFVGCSGLTSVTIPESVTNIGDFAFAGCNGLTSVTILGNVMSHWGYYDYYGYWHSSCPFDNCTNIATLVLGDKMTTIGAGMFSGCSGLTSVTIPESVTNIGYFAFSACRGLTSVTILGNVTSDWAGWGHPSSPFDNCTSIATLVLGDKMTQIGAYMFSSCSGLTSVAIPDSVTWIGDSAFSGCSGLTSVAIPDSVTWIGDSAFFGCRGLTSVTIPNSVTRIGNSVFSGCSGLTSVMIPDGVTSIESGAFSGCSELTSVKIPASVIQLDTTAFDGCGRLWTSWYRTLANLSAGGGESGGGGSSGGGKTVSLTVTNVIVHYVTQSVPSEAVIPVTNSTGIVNVIAEVTAGKAIAISEDWAKQYPSFEATFGGDFAAALTMETGKRDGAGNPMRVWQDYVAGTDPTDPGSVFTASLTFDAETHEPVISWSPELSPGEAAKRRYAVSGKVSLLDPDWVPVEGNAGEFNFFRVSVEMR